MKRELTLRQLEVLSAVKAGGSLASIAEKLGGGRTGIYQVITRLAASGHVKLGPKRRLTPKGEKALANAVKNLAATLERAQQPAA